MLILWGHQLLSEERFERKRSERGALERKGSQGRVPERKAPKRRFCGRIWRERGPDGALRENIVPVPRSTELPRSSDQVAFSKAEKVQEHPGRKVCPWVPLSAIERHQVLSNAQAPYLGKIFQHVTSSNIDRSKCMDARSALNSVWC
jgi:hypothetical protein